jgi:exopolysaccharide production protein ExoQ
MKQLTHPADHAEFLKKMERLMLIVLFLMIAGFFTWSENVGITRVLKVVSRLGMTLAAWRLHQMIVKEGAVPSFQWKNIWSPFLYFTYIALGFVSFLWSTDVGYSLLQWTMDIESLLFAFFFMKSLMLLDTYFPGHKIRFSSLMGNTVFMLMCIFVVGMTVNPDGFFRLVEGGDDRRLGGYIMNPNELGMICGLGISCLIFDLYDKKKRLWAIFKIAILLWVLILTKSRSSLVGLLLIANFHLAKFDSKVLKYGLYFAIAAVIPIAVQKLILREGGLDDILSMTGRMPFWKALITEGLPKEPLFGFGFMRIAYGDTFSSVHSYTAHMTHNTFMQVLMNLGFVGETLAITQLTCTIRSFLKEPEQKKLMLLGILIPVLINSFTEFGIFGETNYGILFYQMLIFSVSLDKNKRLIPREKKYLQRKRPELFLPEQSAAAA